MKAEVKKIRVVGRKRKQKKGGRSESKRKMGGREGEKERGRWKKEED